MKLLRVMPAGFTKTSCFRFGSLASMFFVLCLQELIDHVWLRSTNIRLRFLCILSKSRRSFFFSFRCMFLFPKVSRSIVTCWLGYFTFFVYFLNSVVANNVSLRFHCWPSSYRFLNFIFHVFLDLYLVLDERYSQNFDYYWEVAQSLGKPEAFSIWHILTEYASYQL